MMLRGWYGRLGFCELAGAARIQAYPTRFTHCIQQCQSYFITRWSSPPIWISDALQIARSFCAWITQACARPPCRMHYGNTLRAWVM